ncbi:inorganic phosphate transporter [Pseudomonas cavernae]|uniref:inorganic phosphate transporter n=1 Tax=Pseudomonas cavernae TaxID=2320867 RepID=UPI001EE54B8F|nr:inorganic phosphate transporter [Pseudomonas cavernae]
MLDRYHLVEALRAARLPQSPISPVLRQKAGPKGRWAFFLLLAAGLLYAFASLYADILGSGAQLRFGLPLLVLGTALLIALGFEFINGFHDTANAVATVIYTNALPPNAAVLLSGLCNFLGVLLSSGTVAFAIVALLPVDLMLQISSGAGLAMIFALLIAAILWNLGTWWLGLPVSSSHTLIGSIVGVGLAHGLMDGYVDASGGDWQQLLKVGYALLLSPLVGFVGAALLLLALSLGLRNRNQALFREPQGRTPPPWWIRGLLILTCSGVSFAHGSNDGQKGIGLIMLILIGTVPLSFALDRAQPQAQTQQFIVLAQAGEQALRRVAAGPTPAEPRQVLIDYQRSEQVGPELLPALAALLASLSSELQRYGSLAAVPQEAVLALHNDLYLSAQTIRLLDHQQQRFDVETWSRLQALRVEGEAAIRFIPLWVKVTVAFALGLGTLVGWRRIVATVGEGIGKTRMTYAQGAAAQLVAMLTIGAADGYGLPVSTTHVLSSGVAGTMVANGSGLQWTTIRNLLLAWVLTLPAAIGLAAGLYWLFIWLL